MLYISCFVTNNCSYISRCNFFSSL